MDAYLRHMPNLISAARILLVGPIVWSLLQRQFELAPLVCVAIVGQAHILPFVIKNTHIHLYNPHYDP